MKENPAPGHSALPYCHAARPPRRRLSHYDCARRLSALWAAKPSTPLRVLAACSRALRASNQTISPQPSYSAAGGSLLVLIVQGPVPPISSDFLRWGFRLKLLAPVSSNNGGLQTESGFRRLLKRVWNESRLRFTLRLPIAKRVWCVRR